MDAMRCPKFTSQPSPSVHLASNWLKVVWIDALSHAAKVVQLQSFRDRTAVVLVTPAVRIDLLPLVFERAVSAWVKRANPLPAASCLVDDNVLLEADFPRRCRATALSWFWLNFFHGGIIPQNRGFARTYFCYTFGMPLYDYFCEMCESSVEIMHSMEEDVERLHENCGGHLVRLFSVPEVVYQGKGWAKKDRS
jgi:putative FmdB family regulatory protein